MKQFIYLDSNSVNSIIAQADKGLVIEMSNTKENTDTSHNANNTQVSAEGSISGGLSRLLKAQGTLAATGGTSKDFEISSAIKEIETKNTT